MVKSVRSGKERMMTQFRSCFIGILLIFFLIFDRILFAQDISPSQITYKENTYLLYPNILDTQPLIPSPYRDKNGVEIIVVHTNDEKWAIVPVTLENNDKKGNQLYVNKKDFPFFLEN